MKDCKAVNIPNKCEDCIFWDHYDYNPKCHLHNRVYINENKKPDFCKTKTLVDLDEVVKIVNNNECSYCDAPITYQNTISEEIKALAYNSKSEMRRLEHMEEKNV